MKKSNKIYDELSKDYSDSELADSFIFSVELPEGEAQEAHKEFLKLRFDRLKSMSEAEILAAKLFVFKLQLQKYFKREKFETDFSFSSGLKKYVELTGRTSTEIAKNLCIHKTKLSRLTNGRENPNIDLMYRLEEHSSKEIPAFYWWRLYSRELEHKIRTDYAKKMVEAGKVRDALDLRA